MEFDPIGFFRCDAARRYETPRQGVFAGVEGCVELLPGHDFETALRDLDGFERAWLLFVFDRNSGGWRPTARPPVSAPGHRRVGLFASRAPYRPNPIGLSCVKIRGISGRSLYVAEADLLDGTPILDVKPYIPSADAFPDAKAGWVEEQVADRWDVVAAPEFLEAVDVVRAAGAPDILRSATLQLSQNPFDTSRKRILRTPTGGILSLRMFRIAFTVSGEDKRVKLQFLGSGYTPEELDEAEDPYEDKAFHRALHRFRFARNQDFNVPNGESVSPAGRSL